MSTPSTKRVAYVVSEALVKAASALPSNRGRSSMVHSLANALGFFRPDVLPNLRALKPSSASTSDLCTFHDSEFIDFLMKWSGKEDEESDAEMFGLEHVECLNLLSPRTSNGPAVFQDCPYFPGLKEYILLLGGAVLDAVGVLKSGQVDVSIVWDGGRHHASKERASGYCYINDCNLAILSMRKLNPRPRVLYIDLDLHYSDGVSEAFLSTSKTPSVLTLSIHHAAPGFYPASEHAKLTPIDTTHPFMLSLPLHEGASNNTLARIWTECVVPVKDAFSPEFIILQCGVDGLAGDPCSIWNLGLDVNLAGSLGWVVQNVMDWDKRTLLLGGGGYDSPNVARAWSYLTSVACGNPLPMETAIPEHTAFPLYAPSFTIEVSPGNRPDRNASVYLDEVKENFAGLTDRLRELCAENKPSGAT